MCRMNYQPVNADSSPCGKCLEDLTTCMPIVVNSFLFGECDTDYCEWCSYYEECRNAERSC